MTVARVKGRIFLIRVRQVKMTHGTNPLELKAAKMKWRGFLSCVNKSLGVNTTTKHGSQFDPTK